MVLPFVDREIAVIERQGEQGRGPCAAFNQAFASPADRSQRLFSKSGLLAETLAAPEFGRAEAFLAGQLEFGHG